MKSEDLRKLLARTELCGIYHLPQSGREALREAAEALEFACFKIDFHESDNMASILAILGQSLDFPAWYGVNLDALQDCLTDFSWRQASGYLIIISGADTLRAEEEPFLTLNEVFASTIDEWRLQKTPFWVFYDMRANGLATLPTLA